MAERERGIEGAKGAAELAGVMVTIGALAVFAFISMFTGRRR